jgi:hypothetical protein
MHSSFNVCLSSMFTDVYKINFCMNSTGSCAKGPCGSCAGGKRPSDVGGWTQQRWPPQVPGDGLTR